MDLETLKAVQAPIKERYRNDPTEAIVELTAKGTVVVPEQQCQISNHGTNIIAGLHSAAGGNGRDACSGEMLLESLVACAGVTLAAVATNMSLQIDSCEIEATGTMDFRGTLGVDRNAPVGLTKIELRFQISSIEPTESINKLIQLTERYCVIYQTLKSGIAISTKLGNGTEN